MCLNILHLMSSYDLSSIDLVEFEGMISILANDNEGSRKMYRSKI